MNQAANQARSGASSFDRFVERLECEDPTLRERVEAAKLAMFGGEDDGTAGVTAPLSPKPQPPLLGHTAEGSEA